ncbi:hypothetical protein NKR23_g4415 [Pleurostoma richardsiae]|uniref:Genetic interactor of prohibitins 3, mitochondrial n=1 Tax=Pleurostoma richardsiae TaxID=41990 RepID=A0AA38S2F1_9PEZI|nr:hypothetical protein NKR23_g4415 [Pleurostoma richardsiae]
MQSSRTLSSRWLRNALNVERSLPAVQLPLFLCPAAAHSVSLSTRRGPNPQKRQIRRLHLDHASSTLHDPPHIQGALETRTLPLQCSGCGALSQTKHPEQAGYYSPDRKAVRRYLGLEKEEKRHRDEDKVLEQALQHINPAELGLALDPDTLLSKGRETNAEESEKGSNEAPLPLCDRCHNLVHYNAGKSIYHPSIESLRETIEESPYKYNHVYHVLDAADFPMSLLPKVHSLLDLMPLRSQNRRAKHSRFYDDKKTEMSFIVTRSDLLAPRKDQVDSLMPYLSEALRDALGRTARNVRLGNVRCVSAKRSWWTSELREDIWKRGGAGWLVGKANVGKSQLFNAVFPKGRMDWAPPKKEISVPVYPRLPEVPGSKQAKVTADAGRSQVELTEDDLEEEAEDLDEFSLLPPPQPETDYPAMPVVSSLPGTTASPIRVPFGNGKGELIDLPGLARTDLELYVREEHRDSLLMKSRITPEQQVIRPGQSLLLGGFIRITPRTDDLTFLSYAFTPIKPHLTSTEKAVKIQEQTGEVNVENIAVPGAGEKTRHAGSFELRWDVTKRRAGPLTRRDAVKLKVEQLPFRVLALDILIEGCGWVEVVAQVRARDLYAPRKKAGSAAAATGDGELLLQDLDLLAEPEDPAKEGEPNWPVVDVYSPEGRFIGSRRPMNAWLLNKPLKTAKSTKSRPRKSMKGAKKREKTERRAGVAAEGSGTSQGW